MGLKDKKIYASKYDYIITGGNVMDSIVNWDEKVKQLEISDPEAYRILNRIYKYYSDKGTMKIPDSFREPGLVLCGGS